MKNSTKKTVAAMSAALMLMTGGIVASYAQADVVSADEFTEGENMLKLDHNYIVGNMTLGKSDEENAIASEDGQLYLYTNDETIVVGKDGSQKTLEDLKEGVNIEFYIDVNAPTTLQLPVHYRPQVIVINDSQEDSLILCEIGVFDENLVNEENTLQLNIGKETAYYSKTRDIFHGGKALVFYDITTRSIPAQTTPLAIVKLNDDPQEPEVDLSQVRKVVIGDKIIDHVPVVVDGVQMLPVREFAEAMGYKVDWNNDDRTVTVGHAFFAIDTDSYVIGRRAPVTLGQAPVLIDIENSGYASTFVPVTFFTQVLGETITVDGDTATVQIRENVEE